MSPSLAAGSWGRRYRPAISTLKRSIAASAYPIVSLSLRTRSSVFSRATRIGSFTDRATTTRPVPRTCAMRPVNHVYPWSWWILFQDPFRRDRSTFSKERYKRFKEILGLLKSVTCPPPHIFSWPPIYWFTFIVIHPTYSNYFSEFANDIFVCHLQRCSWYGVLNTFFGAHVYEEASLTLE
jgi:hypothetical protein